MANDFPGRLIVLEGLDNVGKTTLCRRLAQALRSTGTRCALASFPGQTSGTLSKHVYELYHKPKKFRVHRIKHDALQVLLTAAHIDVIESEIAPAISRGVTVILDRFWWSTWVYGLSSGLDEATVKALLKLESLAWRGLTPHHVFLITRKESLVGRSNITRDRLYRTLARREASRRRYKVSIIKNDGELKKSLDSINSIIDDVIR